MSIPADILNAEPIATGNPSVLYSGQALPLP
jgi:hypothetical protein